MKRIVLVMFFLIGVIYVSAQDTVRYPDKWYGYTPREALIKYDGAEIIYGRQIQELALFDSIQDNNYRNCNSYFSFSPELTAVLMRGVNVDSGASQKMYGIAVTMDPDDFDTLNGSLLVYRGVRMFPRQSAVYPSAVVPDYYDATVDSIYAMPFSAPPLMKQCVFEYDYSLPTVSSLYSNCYEFYFDEPMILSTNPDSNIYIGITNCGFNTYKLNLGRDTSRSQEWFAVNGNPAVLQSHEVQCDCAFRGYMNYYSICAGEGKYTPYYELDGYDSSFWADCYWGIMFPILHPRCTAPKCVAYVGDKIEWCGDPESEVFQVSLTAYPVSADSGMVSTVKDNGFQLPDDLPEPACVAYVRKMCTFEFESHTDTVWGDWSEPVVVYGDTTGLGGGTGDDSLRIAAVEQIEVALVPNPATERVSVAAEGMESVELVTVEGATVLRRDCRGECTLDLKGLANGTYMVRVTTAKGVATRKLVVQR